MSPPASAGTTPGAHLPPTRVVLTDHPWPDVEIEQMILSAAGFELIAGPIRAGTAAEIERLVAAHDPRAIMTCWAPVSAAAVARPTALRVVARLGVGLDNIAVQAATDRGAWVTNVPDYCVEEVSDHAVALLLNEWRGISRLDRQSKQGRWDPASAALKRVRNMTVGVFGYGRIGSATAGKLAQGFGCRVLVTSPTLLEKYRAGHELAPRIVVATGADIQHHADAIVLHLPLTATNRHFINEAFLQRCARKPFLVNVSRGGLIDNSALMHALDLGQLSGAALDVVEGEPAPPANVIARADVIATPHIAFSSDASIAEVRTRSTEEVVRVLQGKVPFHACNSPHRPG